MILEEEEMALPLHSVKTTVIHHRDTTRSISPLHLWKQYDETVQDCSLGGGGGVTQQMFIYTGRYGEAPPQGPNPYPLYTIFLREGTHFAYPLLTNRVTVSHTLIRILHPFPDR